MKDNTNNPLPKEQQDALSKFFGTALEAEKYKYKGNYYIYPMNDKYNIYDKPRNISVDNTDISIHKYFTEYARHISSRNSETEAKAFIDGMIYSQENCYEETLMMHAIKQAENSKAQ